MTPTMTMKWIVPALLITLAAVGDLMAWAAPSMAEENSSRASAEPAGPDAGSVATSLPAPASTPRVADSRIATDAELVGTAVVEGGTSFAVFQVASGTRLVREGDEIAGGVRLVQVRRNQIEVERNGVREEIRLGSSAGVRQQVRSGSTRVESGVEIRRRLREDLRARGRL